MLTRRLCVAAVFLLSSTLISGANAKSIRGSQQRRQLIGLCQGECASNVDCDGNLVCYQRNAPGELPGCGKIGATRKNLCVPAWLLPRAEEAQEPSISRATPTPITSTFPNEYTYQITMELNYGYPAGSSTTRVPTQAEYDGARAAIHNWVNQVTKSAYGKSQSYQYVRTDIVQITSKSRTKWVAGLKAVFRANSKVAIPNQYWYSTMLNNADGALLIEGLRVASPQTSIFRGVRSVTRVMNPFFPPLSP